MSFVQKAEAARDVIREAEDVVCYAWMGYLREAEYDAVAALRVCVHMRDEFRSVLRDAESAGDFAVAAEAQRGLESVEHDFVECSAAYDWVRQLMMDEMARRGDER